MAKVAENFLSVLYLYLCQWHLFGLVFLRADLIPGNVRCPGIYALAGSIQIYIELVVKTSLSLLTAVCIFSFCLHNAVL